jgi:hypothetical protein
MSRSSNAALPSDIRPSELPGHELASELPGNGRT